MHKKSRYKVLLVALPPVFPVVDKPTHHPIHLCYTASAVDPHLADVQPLDAHFFQLSKQAIVAAIHAAKADCTLLFQEDHQRWIPAQTTRTVLKELRRSGFGGLVGVVGITRAVKLTPFLKDGADFILPCNPETVVPQIAVRHAYRSDEVAGLEGIQLTAEEEQPLMEEWELKMMPRWELFPYLKYPVPPFRLKAKPCLPLLTTTGCPFACCFCPASQTGWAQRSVESVLEECRYLVRKYGAREIYFADPTFGIDREWVYAFTQSLPKVLPKLIWSCTTRVDVVDREMLKWLREAGCYSLLFGLESSSPAVLSLNAKGFTRDSAEEKVRLAHELGFEVTGTFIFGVKGDTPARARATIRWAKSLPLDFAIFSVMTQIRHDQVGEETYSETDFNPAYIFKGKVRVPAEYDSASFLFEIQHRAYRDFYLRPSLCWHHLKKAFHREYLDRYQAALFFLPRVILSSPQHASSRLRT